MKDNTEENRISLEDNSDKYQEAMAEAQDTTESATQDKKGGAQPESGDPWYTKPESMGGAAGDKIQSVLSPVGNTAGKGLETVARPVGGLVEPLVGGLMKSGKAFGEQAGVGFGNAEGGPAKAAEAEGERMKKNVGGEEQTADNPLGLNKDS